MFLINIVDPFVQATGWSFLNEISFVSIIVRLLLSVICGGLLGLERSKKHQAAGFRTYILVCLGSTIAMLTNEYISIQFNMGDTARLGAQVISGIGFLGAGTILITSKNRIIGLTTAAGLWACACLGLSIGIGFYTLAILSTIVVVVIFSLLPAFEKNLTKRSKRFNIHIEFECRANLKDFVNTVRNMGIKINSISYNEAYSSSGLSVYSIQFDLNKNETKNHDFYINNFKKLNYVNYVEEI